MIHISLVVLPGTGQRVVQLPTNATLETLVEQESLQGRQLCINGQIVPRTAWSNIVLKSRCEVAALQGSKGNSLIIK